MDTNLIPNLHEENQDSLQRALLQMSPEELNENLEFLYAPQGDFPRVLPRMLARADFSQVLPLSRCLQEQSQLTSATPGFTHPSIVYP